jgi:hypothetical protein
MPLFWQWAAAPQLDHPTAALPVQTAEQNTKQTWRVCAEAAGVLKQLIC